MGSFLVFREVTGSYCVWRLDGESRRHGGLLPAGEATNERHSVSKSSSVGDG